MSKYKEVMFVKGIMQKEVLDSVRRVDPRVDKSLLSKIVNDICLPTRPTLEGICNALSCDVLDIYDEREIMLAPTKSHGTHKKCTENARTERTRRRRQKTPFYNLTVEIDRELAERVFSKASLRKLGYLSKTDFIRSMVEQAAKRLEETDGK